MFVLLFKSGVGLMCGVGLVIGGLRRYKGDGLGSAFWVKEITRVRFVLTNNPKDHFCSLPNHEGLKW